MKLTPADRETAVWRRLHAHYADRLAVLRAMNDGDHDEISTARLRGRIAEIKALLDLASDDEPSVTAQPADGMNVSFANE